MTDKKIIRGAKGGKGGGGGGRVAQEAPDSLRSIAYASVLDLVSEGEIEGLANGLKSVYFNQTPLQNDNGSFNFTGATVVATNGSQAQSYIEGFPNVENELPVGLKVENSSPIVRTINDEDIDAVRVRISIPQLTEQNLTNGDLNGSEVTYAIDIQSDGGGYVPQILSDGWTVGSVNKVSDISAKATVPVTQISIGINSLGANTDYIVQYKLQSEPDTAWTDKAVSWVDGTEVNSVSGKFMQLIASAVNIAFGKRVYTMPVKDFGLWEMRVVISTGSAGIVSVAGNSGIESATVKGKTTSKYERSHRLKLTGDAPWDIRVRRINLDATSVAVQNDIFWESYTEIIDGKFRYPNSAIVGVRIDSSQFTNIPTRAYDLKLIKVKIPSNYDPITRLYTGIWDGTFKVAWSDNPAWCFYDLITNTRYGLGDFIAESQVDKWILYAIGRYCDELVPDGFGGQEPRFTCNIYMQTREEAYNVVNSMATIFRGMPYWASGAITVGYDAPSDPVYQFTNSNVIDGSFNYSGSALKARHTVALVTWNDPDDFYRQKVEYVEDADGIARYGIIQTEVVAVGCTSRGQANRVGRWLLFTEQNETEIVTFRTGLEGFVARPSQIIQIADEMRAGTRLGGRIVSSTSNSVVLDADISSVANISTGTISVILPSGNLETKNISNVSGSTITVSSNFSETPAVNAIWMVETSTLSLQTFKVVSVVETQDGVDITALAHNPDKYAYIEQGLKLAPRVVSSLSVVPNAPTNLSVAENLYEQGTEVKVLITLSWSPVANATAYAISYRYGNSNYINLPNTSTNSVDIRDAVDGQYTFKVFALNSLNSRSIPTELNATIYGKTAPPADVTGFTINIIGTQAHLTWNAVPDLDLSHYVIRHSRSTEGATYAKAVDLLTKVPRPAVSAIAPAMTGTYFIKAVDKSGYESANSTEIVALIDGIPDLNVIETIVESPTFNGVKDEVVVNEENYLILDTASDFDDIEGLFDDVDGDFDGGGGTTSTTGTYYFENFVDLGNAYTSRVTANIDVDRIDYVNLFDDAEGDFDQRVGLFDGDPSTYSDTNAELYVAVTDDDPNGSPVTWSSWRKFFVGDYKARGLKFKAVLTTKALESTPAITQLSVTVDMPDRTTSGDDISSGAGAKVVSFTKAFKVTPALGISAQNLQQGDYYEISSKSANGFTITFKNSSGTAVDRTFDYVARGYGELVT
jgi:predicted phage tail protein